MTTGDRAGGDDAEAVAVLGSGPMAGLAGELSDRLHEPEWMKRARAHAIERFLAQGVPEWAAFLKRLDFPRILAGPRRSAAESPSPGLPAGLGALAESETAYRAVRANLLERGVLFMRTDEALRRVPDRFKATFGSAVPADAGPFAALNAALWSGGSFLYVPPGVRLEIPLQAEIREDYERVEPFERTLICADEGADVTYIEGCTAPVYTPDEIHLSVIEVIVRPGAHVRYIALQNFSGEIDNLVTKRAIVHAGASMEWVDANLGSRRTWKAPETVLAGDGASAEAYAWTVAGHGQRQDVGASIVHRASNTRSRVVLRCVAAGGGRVSLRPRVRAEAGVVRAMSTAECSSLLLDGRSRSEVTPEADMEGADAEIRLDGRTHRLGEEMLFYLTSRGLTRDDAIRAVVEGLAEVVTRRIPFEYAVEVGRITELELGGAIG